MNIRSTYFFLLVSVFSLITLQGYSQVIKPIEWYYSTSEKEVAIGDEVELIFKAKIDKDWYLYSSDFDPELGPMVTEFEFEENASYSLIGGIKPINPKQKYDEIFEGDYTYFKEEGEFRQKVKIISNDLIINGSFFYQVCSDVDGKCIPFDEEFDGSKFGIQVLSEGIEENTSPITASPASTSGVLHPALWNVSLSKTKYTEGEIIEIIFDVEIDDDWYLYSNDFDPDLGPMVTEFIFQPSDSYELIGDVIPQNPKTKYDEIFEGDYTYFKEAGQFRQQIKVLKSELAIEGSYLYQVCSDVDGKCIPFEEDFTVGGVDKAVSAQERQDDNLQLASNSGLNQRDPNDPYSLLGFFFIAFMAGLAALLTPCVFPMIPVTVTFFTKTSTSRNESVKKALIYGFSIILFFVVLGFAVSVLFGAEVMNQVATSATANIIFFVIFTVFGLSFLGLFEITLPSSFVNNVDRQADRGGYIGILFMALTLVVVSFSCTGPIVGSILVESAGGQVLKPVIGMLGFSLSFAIPFTLFAIFPETLNKLPKSGGWLNSVKVVLGFLELALALKFLSIADQVYHWGILNRDVYLAFWIVIFTLMALYLLGKIRLPNDSELKSVSVPRLVFALMTLSFVVYLIPGMFGAPLKQLSGYLPPSTSQEFDLVSVIRENSGGSSLVASDQNQICDQPKYAEFLKLPHGIQGYFDFQQAIECAKSQNKPLFIDFTGHGCVNCREMEARVWSDPAVLSRLKNDFVVVALYVDDKKELPEMDWYTSTYDNKVKKTIGRQNADFQITRFNNNAQPFYVILDNNEQLLALPKAYDLDVTSFVEFLDSAKKNFSNKQTIAMD